MNYTTEEHVENYALTDIDAGFSTTLTAWISAMSKMMDRRANRTLATGTSSVRKYDGNGETEMLIDECCNITAITVDGVDVFGKALQYPANASNQYKLSFDQDTFSKGRQNVIVTGKFAMNSVSADTAVAEVPDDIRFICTVLVAGIVNNSNNQNDAVKSEKIGNFSVTYNDPNQRKDFMMVKRMLEGYRRIAV
jgi:hypothetical protein